jgi:hypothetical protein
MTMLQIMTPYAMNALTNALKTYMVQAPGFTIKLFQNNIVPTPGNVLADFTEATYDGYAAQVFTVFFGPTRYSDGSFQCFNFSTWHMTGSTTPNQIYGIYVLDFAGNLLLATRFPSVVSMVDAFSFLQLNFHMGIGPNGLFGDADVEP